MANVYPQQIPCLVIQLNEQQFIKDNAVIGSVMNVPTNNVFINSVDYWFVPVKDEGIFSILQPILKIDTDGNPVPQPSYDSRTVFRVQDGISNNCYWVYGSVADFNDAASSCCGDSPPILMLGIDGIDWVIAPCSIICLLNEESDYYSIFGLPSLAAGETYFPIGAYDNTAFPDANPNGYATIADLLVFLNANYTNTGSPPAEFVWTSPDDLTLIATGGFLGESLCIFIEAITP